MKKFTFLLLILGLWSCQNAPDTKSPGPDPESTESIPTLSDVVTTAESVPVTLGDCGGEEVDPETGRRLTLPNVDLVISFVEVKNTAKGARITPTVKNLCKEDVTSDFEIMVFPDGDRSKGNTIRMSDIPGLGDRVGGTVGVVRGASYTLVLDWKNAVDEANEDNNRCVVTETGRCR